MMKREDDKQQIRGRKEEVRNNRKKKIKQSQKGKNKMINGEDDKQQRGGKKGEERNKIKMKRKRREENREIGRQAYSLGCY